MFRGCGGNSNGFRRALSGSTITLRARKHGRNSCLPQVVESGTIRNVAFLCPESRVGDWL